jgi:hypothetical protein
MMAELKARLEERKAYREEMRACHEEMMAKLDVYHERMMVCL